MRVNNDMLCDLAALVEFDDASLRPAGAGIGAAGANGTDGQLAGRFLRYTFVPGLGVGHPAILYDEVGGALAVCAAPRQLRLQWDQDSPAPAVQS